MKNIKKLIFLTVFLIVFCAGNFNLFAQNYNIDYYGLVAQHLDENMAKMTSDLYYTLLTELSNFTVNDKRTTASRTSVPDFTNISTENLIFFTEIQKDENSEKWTAIFTLIDKQKSKQYAKSKTYDSFYKILMESKDELRKTIKELVEENPALEISGETTKKEETKSTTVSSSIKQVTAIEELSGTWAGEPSIIDKIVILRGGRGFVIFNNGASMNITVSLENNGEKVIITQKGNSNASYYPELPRNIALDAAITAPPIKWTMSLRDNMVLVGKKSTLVQADNSYKPGEVDVIWEKLN